MFLALKKLPKVDLVTAGFPCADLSPAGKLAGIEGPQSSLIGELFRLLHACPLPRYVLIENVPFMLQLNKGKAIKFIVDELSKLGYFWAYRVVDTRSFGLPQRRRRVLLLASLLENPRDILFVDEAKTHPKRKKVSSYGFYWTEGNTGLGWAENAVPTLKGGSGLGIPSPPAIWIPGKGIFTPTISDTERLQGFRKGWTSPVGTDHARKRWKLVGNAVSVPVSKWVGQRMRNPGKYDISKDVEITPEMTGWPYAAWGSSNRVFKSNVSEWPSKSEWTPLMDFLAESPVPLSRLAASGFLKRARASSLNFQPRFLDELAQYLDRPHSSK